MKALAEAGSLGGSKLNLKGTGWKTDGTSRSMDGDEVASGTDCIVISGTRLTPSKPFASVLASSVCLGLACCGETTLIFVSDARSTPDVYLKFSENQNLKHICKLVWREVLKQK